jgi:carbamoyltransferase
LNVLGLSFDYHDAAAALVVKGVPVAAAAEERFSRLKHDRRLPKNAIDFCLARAGLDAGDLDAVVFYEKPFRKLSRILAGAVSTFPASGALFRRAMGAWIDERLWVGPRIESALGIAPEKILYCEHHLSHAASAFLCSPYDDAATLTVDGVGEWATAAIGRGRRGGPDAAFDLSLDVELRYPHSLGLLYSAFTAYLGFEVNEGEYKVMGLAPYGTPRYADAIRKMIEPFADGSFRLDLDWFAFQRDPARSFSKRFEAAFGPARAPGSGDPAGDKRLCDVAASIQLVCEELMLGLAREARRRTGSPRLCLAGGVALNAVSNARLVREAGCESIWIQPAGGDAGGALGAALYAAHALGADPARYEMKSAALGPEHPEADASAALKAADLPFVELRGEDELCDRVSGLLAEGKVVGWHQGRSEWGPRSLGQRSILADPRPAGMKDTVNAKIKFREMYRPFAPSICVDAAAEWFDLPGAPAPDPYRFMLATAQTREDRRDRLAAVTHVDGSSRVQTIDPAQSPLFHRLAQAMGRRTGVPAALNTSFNLKGEPIVETPADAVSTFLSSGMDALAVGPFLTTGRPENPKPRRESCASSETRSDGLGW